MRERERATGAIDARLSRRGARIIRDRPPFRNARTGRIPRRVAGLALAAVVTVGAAGCSTDPPSTPDSAAQGAQQSAAVSVAADGTQVVILTGTSDMRFSPQAVAVRPGRVTLRLHNAGGGSPHQVAVEGVPGAAINMVAAGQTGEVTFIVDKPGVYRLVCGWHEAAGMTGTLTVSGAPIPDGSSTS